MPEPLLVIGSIGPFLTLSTTSSIRTPMLSRTKQKQCVWSLAVLLLLPASSVLARESALERAAAYRPYLRQTAISLWGWDAPITLFAGQIHQESGWNPLARSKYACGLTQFTPETAEWIAREYRVEVGAGECTDARWAIRAMVRYDKYLSGKTGGKTHCDNRRFMLSAYNGGLGWVFRDRSKAMAAGKDGGAYDAVAPYNAGRGSEFFAENRAYPEKIVGHQSFYKDWGGEMTCKEKS